MRRRCSIFELLLLPDDCEQHPHAKHRRGWCESAPVIANARNDVAACNAVRAFINALEALSGKHIPEAEAAALVEMAHQTLEFLGCSDKHGRDSDLRWVGRERPGHSR